MNSWWTSNNAGNEPPTSSYPINGWPTPHASTSNQPSPSRREHALQPPPLTTAFNGHQYHGLGVALSASYSSTPLSTTSLSSPFTHSLSPATSTSGNIASASSSMASRQYNVPYNPQDWGPVNSSVQSSYPQTNNMLRIVPQSRPSGPHSDISLSPPPPPYSPPSQQQQHQSRGHTAHNSSGRGSASPGPVSTYNGVIQNNIEPPVEYRQRPLPRTRPLSMAHVSDANQSRHVSLPPPPPLSQAGPSSRSSSRHASDAYRESTSFSTAPTPYIRVQPQDNVQHSHLSSHNHLGAQFDDPNRPPASRRAVSAGPIVNSSSSSRATSQSRSRSPTNGGWEPGMPLPPPPPGPPPTTRSQSVSGLSDTTTLRHSQTQPRSVRTRPPPVLGTGLDSIPPTPAGWVDEAPKETTHRRGAPLAIDTTGTSSSRDNLTGASSTGPSPNPAGNGLFRSPALRDPNAKGIRERRIERRNRQSQAFDDFSAVSMNSNPWAEALDRVKPSNLVLEDMNATPDPIQHQIPTKVTPRSSAGHGSDGEQPNSRPRASSTGLFSDRSSFSTPRADPSPSGPPRAFAQTPPFSPGGDKSTYSRSASQPLPPKALPTPPLLSGQDTSPPSRSVSRDGRPVSHVIHSQNDVLPSASTLSPRRVPSQKGPSLDSVVSQDVGFVQNAIQRHKSFIEEEAGAADETEALKIFTEYIISESQIRREKYTKAWNSGALNIEEVCQKLFEMPPKPQVASAPLSRRPSRGAPRLTIPQSRPESAWWNNYQPCLSPIASLSMSNDEMSSRGRAPSRWWESKSSSEGGERKIERSKRESKYMGLPRESLQWGEARGHVEAGHSSHSFDPAVQYAIYGSDEYPPEKVGWHEEQASSDYSSTAGHTNRSYARETQKMDVSRLITLPPPYPRHHPAVNNCHPDLVNYRTLVRSISDLSEIKSTRQKHQADVERLSRSHKEKIQEGRRHFKANIQSQIEQGSITFAEAAEAEAALIMEEHKLERELAKQELDCYQESVLQPMHAILTDRIEKATSSIDDLRSKLFDDAQHETPDQTQEEGDEKPELLEKLTQLKWLFEAREQLHREMYELFGDRDEKYKTVILLPYKQKTNEEKVRGTEAFFAKDALDRRVKHEASALARLESFQVVIEEYVVRGVEMQLSAFWDIAPSLLTLVQQIPTDIAGFQIQIPGNEYEENPSYQHHPLQYLYTLLAHAEKSSYQFIESQINLFCLLHEVKSAVMKANCRLMQAERVRQGETEDRVRSEMQASRADEERSLTNDLKDKVATVEGQWTEALGSAIQGLRERVKEQLDREDGWEDELEQLEE